MMALRLLLEVWEEEGGNREKEEEEKGGKRERERERERRSTQCMVL
jgi:hypothetical protein